MGVGAEAAAGAAGATARKINTIITAEREGINTKKVTLNAEANSKFADFSNYCQRTNNKNYDYAKEPIKSLFLSMLKSKKIGIMDPRKMHEPGREGGGMVGGAGYIDKSYIDAAGQSLGKGIGKLGRGTIGIGMGLGNVASSLGSGTKTMLETTAGIKYYDSNAAKILSPENSEVFFQYLNNILNLLEIQDVTIELSQSLKLKFIKKLCSHLKSFLNVKQKFLGSSINFFDNFIDKQDNYDKLLTYINESLSNEKYKKINYLDDKRLFNYLINKIFDLDLFIKEKGDPDKIKKSIEKDLDGIFGIDTPSEISSQNAEINKELNEIFGLTPANMKTFRELLKIIDKKIEDGQPFSSINAAFKKGTPNYELELDGNKIIMTKISDPKSPNTQDKIYEEDKNATKRHSENLENKLKEIISEVGSPDELIKLLATSIPGLNVNDEVA